MNYKKIILIFSFLFINILTNFIKADEIKKELYFCTASDSKYFNNLLNLIGSIHKNNFKDLGEIAVYNLGLNNEEIKLLKTIEKVNVYEIELTNPDLLKQFKTTIQGKTVPGWYAWKPVVIKQALEKFPYVLWIDTGLAVLKPINDLFKYIQTNGYFLCTIGEETQNDKYPHSVRWQTTKHLVEKFNLNAPGKKWILDQESILGSTFGASRAALNNLILPFYEFSKDLKNFEDDFHPRRLWYRKT